MVNNPNIHRHNRPLGNRPPAHSQPPLPRHARKAHRRRRKHAHRLLDTRLEEGQFLRVGKAHDAAADVGDARGVDLSAHARPGGGVADHEVDEGLEGGGDGVEGGAMDFVLLHAIGLVVEHAQPVGEGVEAGVGVGLALADGGHGGVDQVAPGGDAEPGDEAVAEEGDVQPAEEAGDGDVGRLRVRAGDGVVDVVALAQEAELLGEDGLADDVRGCEGEELVEVDGGARGGEPVEPPAEELDGLADVGLRLDDVGQGVGGGQVPGELVLHGRVRGAHGVLEAAIGEGDDLVPVALVERCPENLADGVGVADADLIRGNADEVALGACELAMGLRHVSGVTRNERKETLRRTMLFV